MDSAKTPKYETLPVLEIALDIANPRIAKWLEMYGGTITAEQMSMALGAADDSEGEGGTTFHSLREAIKTSGGIIHPIIVNKDERGQHMVIEGNTRTLIYREFLEQKAKGNWSQIPAMVYDGLSQTDIDAIRLQAHLVGPRAWDPYSKAKYLNHLRNSEHLTYSQIVDLSGGRTREVQDYIAAYHDMEKHYRPLLESDDQFDPTRFSSFVEFQRRRITEAVFAAGFTKDDFARWVKSHLLSPQSTVRSLPGILENPRAREVFLRDGAQEAIKLLDVPTPDQALRDASLIQLAREISRRVLNMPYGELQRLRSHIDGPENEGFCEARDNLTRLCEDIASSD
ncbi:hypothetical protein HZA56_22780 [Candidatus Poribacteria bacterium]|nr:hypothetical protein [Candidatus Poribacteria bacterium]